MNADLPERIRSGKFNRNQSTGGGGSPMEPHDPDITLNTEIRHYVTQQQGVSSTSNKDVWLDMPEIPTSDELHLGDDTVVDLLPNKTKTKFKSVQSYLKTHYQLLREDATSPLRDAIDKYRRDSTMQDDSDLSIYEKVHISGFTFTNNGIAARVKFSTARAGRRIMWSASKRLVSGSLVALTPANDNFKSQCIVAIVAARPLELLERSPPEVDLYFSRPADIQIDPQIEFVMLEAKQGYYEAYRHTSRALQKMSSESFELSQHIIGHNINVDPPQYLSDKPERSLHTVLGDKHTPNSLTAIDLVNCWPERPDSTTLDDSQWDALQHILTKRLAIVQGPPGTGKTHVSKVALQILCQNRCADDPPIIIAAQTNHALDQLLRHVSIFDPLYIRLGGRSTDIEIKKRALFQIRQDERIPNIPGSMFGPARKSLEREQTKYGELLSIFDDTFEPISCDVLLKLGIIDADQQKSLTDAADNLVTADDEGRSPMQHWLNKALAPFKIDYGDDSFGFEDIEDDLEIEQLREVEAEHGVTDEEDIEMLKGPWKAVFDNTMVARPSDTDVKKASQMLRDKKDLWSIPEYLRTSVYYLMKQRAKDITLARFREAALEYEKLVQQFKIGKWEKDAVYLKRANIIGMTTTGLSKYRPLISSLKPKIVLIEEAAEVLEGPVTAACMESVEHLILVGDHKQLQGHCSVSELEGDPYYLNISMFERLVNLSMPFRTLNRQRRMNTEIRQLLGSLYPSLEDHEYVLNRQQPPPWGTGSSRSFFFSHDALEQKDESLSTYNEVEAQMVARFYRHLLRHGVPDRAITILTFYNGQRKRILRELKSDVESNRPYNLVKTVDSYQGEENDIILLSLVRNNQEKRIGFLEVDNRVCVALSRARYGLYLFGNERLLSRGSELWAHVASIMHSSTPQRLGHELPLVCVRHNQHVLVEYPEDFENYDGGCQRRCGEERPCGHPCARKCHPQPHNRLACLEDCNLRLNCGHICTNKCGQQCRCDCETYDQFAQWDATPFSRPGISADMAESRPGTPDANGDEMSGRNSPVQVNAGGSLSRAFPAGRASQDFARGGAAFQPQLTPSQDVFHGLVSQRSGTAQSSARETHATQARGNWTSFANGDARDSATDVEKGETMANVMSDGNLLEMDDPASTQGTVESSTQGITRDGRTKFTQIFQPAVPGQPSSSNGILATQTPIQSGDAKESPSLLD